MFQPVNRDKSINYQVPSSDNIYVDLTIPCSDRTQSAADSYYTINRNNLILPKASDYYATMDSLEVPSETIPKFILFSDPNQNSGEFPWRLDYVIRAIVQSPDWTNQTIEAYLMIDEEQFVSTDSRYSENILWVGDQPVWFLYSVKELLFLINDALGRLSQSLQVTFRNQVGVQDTYYDNNGICYMYMERTPEGRLRFCMNDDLCGYPNTGPGKSTKATGPDVQIVFSDTLYYLLGKFLAVPNQINLTGAGFLLNKRETIYRHQPLPYVVQVPIELAEENAYDYELEIPRVAVWENDNFTYDLQQMFKIIVEASLIPLQNTLNGNTTQDGGKYIITFIPDSIQGYNNNYIFKPLNASKLNDMLANCKLQELSFKFYFLDYLNNRYPLYIPIYKAAILRCLFIKKQLFNNFYQSDTLVKS